MFEIFDKGREPSLWRSFESNWFIIFYEFHLNMQVERTPKQRLECY